MYYTIMAVDANTNIYQGSDKTSEKSFCEVGQCKNIHQLLSFKTSEKKLALSNMRREERWRRKHTTRLTPLFFSPFPSNTKWWTATPQWYCSLHPRLKVMKGCLYHSKRLLRLYAIMILSSFQSCHKKLSPREWVQCPKHYWRSLLETTFQEVRTKGGVIGESFVYSLLRYSS